MAATKTKNAKKSAKSAANGRPVAESSDVLTLAEAAEYLRVPEDAVIDAVQKQGLGGKQIGKEWRFLKSSLRDWLAHPSAASNKQAFLDIAGKFKDDPDLEEITREAYRKRGRAITEDGE